MATLSLKSFVLWFSNLLLPFVLIVKSSDTTKDVVNIIDIFTKNAQILYFIVLCLWVLANVFLIWIKIKKDNVILEIKNLEKKIKEEDLKQKRNENT